MGKNAASLYHGSLLTILVLLDQPSHRRRCGDRRLHLLQDASACQTNTGFA